MTLVFPGPDAHIRHLEYEQPPRGAGEAPPATGEAATASTMTRPAGTGSPGDVGRRAAVERRRRGLSREETVGRARMSPYYWPTRSNSPPIRPWRRSSDRPTRWAPRSPHCVAEAWISRPVRATHCCTPGFGTRIAVSTADGRTAVVPVNYACVDDAIIFRTAPESVTAAAAEREVAFEVDHVDDALSQSRSVLAVAPARVVPDPEAVRRLAQRAHTTQWAGGERGNVGVDRTHQPHGPPDHPCRSVAGHGPDAGLSGPKPSPRSRDSTPTTPSNPLTRRSATQMSEVSWTGPRSLTTPSRTDT